MKFEFSVKEVADRWASLLDAFEDQIAENRGIRRKITKLNTWGAHDFQYSDIDELQTYQWLFVDVMTLIEGNFDLESLSESDPKRLAYELLESMSGDISDVLGN